MVTSVFNGVSPQRASRSKSTTNLGTHQNTSFGGPSFTLRQPHFHGTKLHRSIVSFCRTIIESSKLEEGRSHATVKGSHGNILRPDPTDVTRSRRKLSGDGRPFSAKSRGWVTTHYIFLVVIGSKCFSNLSRSIYAHPGMLLPFLPSSISSLAISVSSEPSYISISDHLTASDYEFHSEQMRIQILN